MNVYDDLFEQLDIIRRMHENFRESDMEHGTIFDGRPISNIMDVADRKAFEEECDEMNNHIEDYLGGIECKETVDQSTVRQRRNSLIEYAKLHLSDLVPYNDPNYETKLQAMAENYADCQINETNIS